MEQLITGHTRLGGLIGSPVSHSLSPAMHNTAFRELGIDFVYLAFDVPKERVGETVRVLRDIGSYGFNVTMPDKRAVMEHLDALSPAAELIGAVNTVVNSDGKLTGHNTDGIGFVQAVRGAGLDVSGIEATLIGAGGAAGAAAVQMALDGVKTLHIAARRSASYPAACALAERISEKTACRAEVTDLADEAALRECIASSALLANATPVGMAPDTDRMPLPDTDMFRRDLTVCDMIYNPRRTKLYIEAQKAGCRVVSGLPMLLGQGAAAFELWTGQKMPVSLIEERFFRE